MNGIGTKMRVLIVDDAQFMRMMLRNILEKNNCEVIGEAGNGNEAVEKYKELKPDLVTMDITMPDADGIRGLQGFKQLANIYTDMQKFN